WKELKQYASEAGIKIIGDIPIYVALDSADVWAEPHWFKLDEKNLPVEVAGVPPDYFTEDGQLWGNPLYEWDKMREDGFGWWIRRIDGASRLYDVIRIDHFRGFESFWAVPYGEKTARNGKWVKGPGVDLINVLKGWFPNISFIAEDLGYLTQDVLDMVEASGLPGMKVLEFAFDAREPGDYLPYNYKENSICYAGTHDNAPLLIWKNEADPDDVKLAERYIGINKEEGFVWGMIRAGMESASKLFITQMQDYLELSEGSRMNTPGTAEGNWKWRMKKGAASTKLAKKIASVTELYGRI
ncbi:MAG: 4-alpha-glucanotransferase, partial [Lachnospiraceae bacterium]|nr:4-alpha-glucanotransferase [Lachnospiraceae bacterium]